MAPRWFWDGRNWQVLRSSKQEAEQAFAEGAISPTEYERYRSVYSHQCGMCGKKFHTAYDLVDHSFKFHKQQAKPAYSVVNYKPPPGVAEYSYDDLKREFAHVSSFKRMQKQMSEPVKPVQRLNLKVHLEFSDIPLEDLREAADRLRWLG